MRSPVPILVVTPLLAAFALRGALAAIDRELHR
jgi:hypothetical protein